MKCSHGEPPAACTENSQPTQAAVALCTAFLAHLAEMAIYGLAIYALINYIGLGSLRGFDRASLENCIYFSAETYTSLGFGDIVPVGPVRLLAGLEALNGLLLVGWSASYVTIAMERFWREEDQSGH
jgi:hypothetical protein